MSNRFIHTFIYKQIENPSFFFICSNSTAIS